ncbi:DEAD/DEAH box helicase [Candidatus Woesearchaeota archaeon]|nr:DEAD/DEAH box helicase [Candidatus Woesearchaeota archaeon]
MEEFKRLGIIEPILKSIEEARFEKPSKIQEKAIPLISEGKDVIGGSETGSGKTLAFGAGIIKNAEKKGFAQALVLTPTRELAEQIEKELKRFSKYKPLNFALIYGGVGINPQIDALETADVVVGTPGRILDHLQRRTIDLKRVNTLVLDEADRMLDMGFIEDVEKIISQCGKERQTMLFSATIPPDIEDLTNRYMNDPVKVSAGSYVDPRKLRQVYYDVPDNLKFSLLVHLLKKEEHSGLVMVFCNSKNNVDFVSKNLKANGIAAHGMHGGFTQQKRSQTLEKFHEQKVDVLVCTDVAARGLDIKGVTHVYNYDIPKESKQYIHRIGRTARAGTKGLAVNILSEHDHENMSRILRDYDVNIEKGERPKVPRVMVKKTERTDYGRGFSRGPRQGGYGDRGPRRDGPRRDGSRGGSGSRSFGGPRSAGQGGPRSGGFGGPRRGGQRSGGQGGPRGPRTGGPRRGGPRQGGFGGRSGGSRPPRQSASNFDSHTARMRASSGASNASASRTSVGDDGQAFPSSAWDNFD